MQTLTVSELIEILQDYDGDTKVMISHTAGDYWKTELASPIGDDVFTSQVEYSAYHNQYKVSKESDYEDDPEENEGTKEVLLLTCKNVY